MTSSQEMERVYSYNPGARTGLANTTDSPKPFTARLMGITANIMATYQEVSFQKLKDITQQE